MIQDIAPHTFENHYHPEAKIRPEDPVLIIRGEKILCRLLTQEEKELDPEAFASGEEIHDGTGRRAAAVKPVVMEFPRWREVLEWSGLDPEAGERFAAGEVTYLFSIDEEHYFLLKEGIPSADREMQMSSPWEAAGKVSEDSKAGNDTNNGTNDITGAVFPQEYDFYGLHDLRERDIGPKVREFAAMTGMHLAHWYRNNRFCGRCGAQTQEDTVERALVCPDCGNKIYPRIVPAVIVGILNPRTSQILLTKYRVGYSHYALVAGFTEIGEALEGTVRREVMEETGLKVKNIRYYKSQPWGIVDDLLAGFYCEVDGDDTIRMDRGELKVAEWVNPEDVELQPQDFSLTNEMMYRFKVNSRAILNSLE